MKIRTRLLAAAAAVTALGLVGCSSAATGGTAGSGEAQVFKLGHIAPPGTAYDDFAARFGELLEEKSGGRYTIEVYPSGQLGVDRELMESLQVGNVDFTVITASDINQFVPEMAVQDLPYLFRDWDHVEAFLDAEAATELYALTDQVGMKTLAFMPRGFRDVTTNVKPIETPDDLQGLKIRVAESEVYLQTFKDLGANAQAMAWSEVFTALQQGTVDAQENTVVTTRDYKINEVQTYMSKTEHFFAFAALQMNTALFDGMSPEDQALIAEAALEAAKESGLDQKNNEEAAAQEMADAGLIINEVADKEAFAAKVQPVYDEYFTNHDRTYFDQIQAIG
ncbi:MAG: TRAP transporter substrate-binding protein [Propioniciclava sp.]